MGKFHFKTYTFGKTFTPERRTSAFLFGPGLFFVLIGALTIFAPGLILAILAAAFFFVGTFLVVAAWKFLQFKKRIEEVAKDFQGKVVMQGFEREEEMTDADFVEVEERTITYH